MHILLALVWKNHSMLETECQLLDIEIDIEALENMPDIDPDTHFAQFVRDLRSIPEKQNEKQKKEEM